MHKTLVLVFALCASLYSVAQSQTQTTTDLANAIAAFAADVKAAPPPANVPVNAIAVNTTVSAALNQSAALTFDGITRAFNSSLCAGGCTVQVEGTYPYDAERSYQLSGTSQHLIDRRGGGEHHFYNGVTPTQAYTDNNFHTENCNTGVVDGRYAIPGTCFVVGYGFTHPGFNYGAGGIPGASGWSTHSAFLLGMGSNGGGIVSAITTHLTAASPADSQSLYAYHTIYGNAMDPANEAASLFSSHIDEASTTYQGINLTGGAQATQLYLNCIADCGNTGVYRYAVDMTSSPITGVAQTFTPDDGGQVMKITTATTLPVSTWYGSLVHDVVTPNISWSNGGHTPYPTWILAQTISGTAATGDLITFASTFGETSRNTGSCAAWSASVGYNDGQGVTYNGSPYTAMDSSTGIAPGTTSDWSPEAISNGQVLFCAPLRWQHTASGWVMANGIAGKGIDWTANIVPSATGELLHYPSPALGSIDAHTAVLGYFNSGSSGNSWNAGFVNYQSTTAQYITLANGIANLVIAYGNQAEINAKTFLVNAPFITITNSTLAAPLRCANTTNTVSGQISCTPCTTLTGACVANTASVQYLNGIVTLGTSGFGTTEWTMRDMAQVYDVQDYRKTPITAYGTSFLVEPNNAAWPAGGVVMMPHWYTQRMDTFFNNQSGANPYMTNSGFMGGDISGYGHAHVSGTGVPTAMFHFGDSVSTTALSGGGGSGQPWIVGYWSGNFGGLNWMENAPFNYAPVTRIYNPPQGSLAGVSNNNGATPLYDLGFYHDQLLSYRWSTREVLLFVQGTGHTLCIADDGTLSRSAIPCQ